MQVFAPNSSTSSCTVRTGQLAYKPLFRYMGLLTIRLLDCFTHLTNDLGYTDTKFNVETHLWSSVRTTVEPTEGVHNTTIIKKVPITVKKA